MLKLPKIVPIGDVLKMLAQINTKCPTGVRNYAIIVMLYRAGLRVSEVCKLRVPDMDFNNELIYIQQSKRNKDRYIPMDADITSTAREWLAIRPESEFFFCTLQGGKLDPRYIREVCYRKSQKAGVFIQDNENKKKVSPHKFRHSYGTELIREGKSLRQVQELLGHEDPRTTEIYTHVTINDLKQAIRGRKSILDN